MLGHDCGDRADVLVVAQGIRRPPLPVGDRPGDVGDLRMDVQLHVAIPGGVLQPVRHRQLRLTPLARLPAMDPGVMRPGPGVAGLPLEVPEPGPDGLPDHVINLGDQGGPVPVTILVSRLAGQPGVLPQRGVEDRNRLGQRNCQVEEQRALPRQAGRLHLEFVLALGGGLRLGRQQPLIYVCGFPAAAWRPCQRRTVRGFALAEQQVIRPALDHLARFEPERFRARAPPPAGRLSPALTGLDVIPGRILRRAAIDLRPDVVQVVALAQRRDNRHRLIPRQPARQN